MTLLQVWNFDEEFSATSDDNSLEDVFVRELDIDGKVDIIDILDSTAPQDEYLDTYVTIFKMFLCYRLWRDLMCRACTNWLSRDAFVLVSILSNIIYSLFFLLFLSAVSSGIRCKLAGVGGVCAEHLGENSRALWPVC